ncbi:hypothetical protein EJ04DRAFT_466963 [Polyplosphaeria fusca]|uniref:F-box domain-containing protein n=1 Tax=Polyplosphaeria fusca TaxID=682080 RepID=A0A9P4R049_9PLEO|nr:hypothetical protein EJ04DRAFT_466963 [Polyplosphaeria fusca]
MSPISVHSSGRGRDMPTPKPNLNNLPNELLTIVYNNLDRPKDVLQLSRTSKTLHDYTKLDGWKAFLQGRFPGAHHLEGDPCVTLHGLTTLYRNWNRKAFVARRILSSDHNEGASPTSLQHDSPSFSRLDDRPVMFNLNTQMEAAWRRPQGQTMGYQPYIDSFEEIGSWTSRNEILAWSAGTHIVIRSKETGLGVAAIAKNHAESPRPTAYLDDYDNLTSFCSYKIPQSQEGLDDITALRLLRPNQRDADTEALVYGSASGRLSLLSVKSRKIREQLYDTENKRVGSLSLSSDASPQVAAILGDGDLALYPVDTRQYSDQPVNAQSLITLIPAGTRQGRLWSCNFLSEDKVAVGLGPSREPIHVYSVTPDGFSAQPLRSFGMVAGYWIERNLGARGSVYPTVSVPSSSQGGSVAGNVFLSGGTDGIIRLHDMRSPSNFDNMFWDVTNDSSIYSVVTQGLERVVAGASMHSMLKVFDLRLSGSHAYDSIPVTPRPSTRHLRVNSDTDKPIRFEGWNAYLNPRHDTTQERSTGRWTPRNGNRRTENSPVYSLSIPSPYSPFLYAGLEGSIMSLDFVSVMDKHPDPLLSQSVTHLSSKGDIDLKTSFNRTGTVQNLGMYEQGNNKSLNMHLMVQMGLGAPLIDHARQRDQTRFARLDERWKDPGGDGDRWQRGQEPAGRGRHLDRGQEPDGRGRHRGRGRGGGRGRAWARE